MGHLKGVPKMTTKPPQEDEPTVRPARLILGNDTLAADLVAYQRTTTARPDGGRAWHRLQERMSPRRGPVGALVAVLLLCGAVSAWVFVLRTGTRVLPAAPATLASPSLMEPGSASRALPQGTVAIGQHASATVRPGSQVSFRKVDKTAEIVVSRGGVAIHTSGDRADPVRVLAGSYVFIDIGTRFDVALNQGAVDLRVFEGAVEVWHQPPGGSRTLLQVVSGPSGAWRNEEVATTPAVIAPSMPPAALSESTDKAATPGAVAQPPNTPRSTISAPPRSRPPRSSHTTGESDPASPGCEALLAGANTKAALDCLELRILGTGLGAETAHYEKARLLRDRLNDPAKAARILENYRHLFPTGSLTLEVRLSLIDLLPRLRRHDEALTESARLLAEMPQLERAAELHLLRGNVYREAKSDCRLALREYAKAEAADSPAGADARFFGALCAEQLGDREGARAKYEAYLREGPAAHSLEARRRLSLLRP